MFKYKIARDDIFYPVASMVNLVDKSVVSTLANIYIQKKDDKNIIFVATNLEMQATICNALNNNIYGDKLNFTNNIIDHSITKHELNNIEENKDHDNTLVCFSLLINAKKLFDVLRVINENQIITLEFNGNRLTIKSHRTKYTLQANISDNYPIFKQSGTQIASFKLKKNLLKKIIGCVQFAMGIQDTRVYLNGMLLELYKDEIRLVTTDGHRLAFAKSNDVELVMHLNESYSSLQHENNSSIIARSIIPRKTVLELSKFMCFDGIDDIVVDIYTQQLIFQSSSRKLITKLLDTKYPPYNKVIPNNYTQKCIIDRQSILKSLQMVSVLGVDRMNAVDFLINNNCLTIKCYNDQKEECIDEIAIDINCHITVEMSLNLNYLLEILSNIDSEKIEISFIDKKRAILLTQHESDNYKYVIMPICTE